MPKMDGIEVISALRKLPGYLIVPTVMITSTISPELRLQAIECGATDFLTKPFHWVELQARVETSSRYGRPRSSCPTGPATLPARSRPRRATSWCARRR